MLADVPTFLCQSIPCILSTPCPAVKAQLRGEGPTPASDLYLNPVSVYFASCAMVLQASYCASLLHCGVALCCAAHAQSTSLLLLQVFKFNQAAHDKAIVEVERSLDQLRRGSVEVAPEDVETGVQQSEDSEVRSGEIDIVGGSEVLMGENDQ